MFGAGWRAAGTRGGLVVLVTALGACGSTGYGGRDDIAAEAGGAELSLDLLGRWVASAPSQTPTLAEAGFAALAWIDYSLLADAASRGAALTDSATAAQALMPDLTLLPLRRWHDSLVARRPRVPTDRPDSLYANPNLRLFQQIFLRVRDPNDVRAITAVRAAADSLLEQVRGGADFQALARARSEDPTGRNGGWLPPGRRGALPQTFERGAWRIQPGEIEGVLTPAGFHIVRRPALEDARERLRVYAESLATQRADSVYLDSLTVARGLTLGPNVPARVRTYFADPRSRTADAGPLISWDGGALGLEQVAVWLDFIPPRTYLQLRGTSDILLERFVGELGQQQLLLEDARRNGVDVTPAEWAALYDGYRRGVAGAIQLLGADSAGALPPGDPASRVTDLMDRFTSDSALWRPLPGALASVLRARAGYRLHEPGMLAAIERVARPGTSAPR